MKRQTTDMGKKGVPLERGRKHTITFVLNVLLVFFYRAENCVCLICISVSKCLSNEFPVGTFNKNHFCFVYVHGKFVMEIGK